MLYLSQLLNKPVVDSDGVTIGRLSDLAIQTGDVFPRITSLAFLGPSKTPFMVSCRKYVGSWDEDKIALTVPSTDIRFSYLQPDELLLSRDLLNKQIVDTQGLKVVRVNDLKLSSSGIQLRLLGAEVGIKGLLRGLSPVLEHAAEALARAFRLPFEENIIAWNYMDLVDRDLSDVKLAMTHKRLSELHPADVADILEQLEPRQRARVFEHLDKQQAAETFSELLDEYQSDIIDDLSEHDAAGLLAQMEPDDAADILGDLPYEKAEKLLWLMGVSDEKRIRQLLGYREKTAGGVMTSEFVAMPASATVDEAVEHLRSLDESHERIHYVYTLDEGGALTGAISLRSLVLAEKSTALSALGETDLITVAPEDDQEQVADQISKYDLLAIPVVDEGRRLLGIVTVDDAMDVLEEEHSEDLELVGAGVFGRSSESAGLGNLLLWLVRKQLWFLLWALLAIVGALTGTLPVLLPALAFAPLVLLVAQEVVAFAFNDLLEYNSATSTLRAARLFARNVIASILMATVGCGLGASLFIAMGSAIDNQAQNSFTPHPLQAMLVEGYLPAVATATLVVVGGVLVTLLVRSRLDKGKSLSVITVTLATMLVSLALLVGLELVMIALTSASIYS